MKTVAFLLATLFAAASAAAQVKVDRFYPPAVGPGESTVTAEGKFPSWPCKIFCDRDDIQFGQEKESGRLKVTVAADSSPGVAWVRFFDQKNASNLVPMLIESIAVTPESSDSGKTPGEANGVTLPAAIAGRLAKNGEVDVVHVSLKSGDTLIGSLIAHQILQSPMDAVLQLADRDGNVLAQSEDVRGLDPQLVYRSADDIDVVVRVFAFPSAPNSSVSFSGSSSHTYVLRLTSGPFLDHVSPIAIGSAVETVTAAGWNLPADPILRRREATSICPPLWQLASGVGWHWQRILKANAANVHAPKDPNAFARADRLPVVFCGRISEAKQIDRLRFSVLKGKKYTAKSYAKSAGFLLDAVLRVIDVKSGDEIARKDDISRTDFDAAVDFRSKEDAEYELQVSDAVEAFGTRHVYAVVLEESLPNIRLSLAAEQFVLPPGGSLEIPVTVGRTNGYAEKVSVTATGLPEGVTATEVVSEAKGDTAKSVKLKLAAKDNVTFQGNVQIVGSALESEGKRSDETYPATFALRPQIDLADVWLSVAKQ